MARGHVAARLAVAEQMPLGPVLIAELVALKAAPMTSELALRRHALWDKVASWVAAEQMIATNDTVHGLRGILELPPGEAQMLAAQEIACTTHTSYATAMTHVALVERVGDCLPACWEALDRGQLTLGHVKAVERVTHHCPPRVAEAVDTTVIPLAVSRGWTPGETAKAARKLVIALDPDGAKKREETARDDSDIRLYPEPDGMATLAATGEASLMHSMMAVLNDHAETLARNGDQRSIGIRRVHALHDLITANTPASATTTDGPRRPARGEALLRLDLDTYLGCNDKPGELTGYGPISADTARRIAADCTLRRLITDPLTGDTIDLGLRSYKPSAALKRIVEAEHPTCTMPGCTKPAHLCEIDHRTEHRNGGRTDRRNLKPLCKMHHQLKTKKRWTVDVNPDGSETWTSYLGITHTKKPAWFPLPEPLEPDNDIPDDENLEWTPLFDPNPPHPDEPLPAPPPLTDEQYEEMEHALDTLDAFGISFRQWCDQYYEQARATGLVA